MLARLMFILLLLVCFALGTAAQSGAGDAASTVSANDHGDPLLRAMLTELKRSQQKLQLGEFQRPYYIDYQLLEVRDYVADARLGRAGSRSIQRRPLRPCRGENRRLQARQFFPRRHRRGRGHADREQRIGAAAPVVARYRQGV